MRIAGFFFALVTAGSIVRGCYGVLAQAAGTALIAPFVLAGVTAFAGMALSWFGIRKNVDIAGEHLLFDTWFPLAMAVVPIAGPFITLWSAFKLLRGRISAATITTSSGGAYRSSSHYDAVEIGAHGLPGGVLLVVAALTQPALAATFGAGDRLVSALDIQPTLNTWHGSMPLECAGSQRFVAHGLTLQSTEGFHPIDARGDCSVELVDCDLKLHNRIFLQDRATLTVRGGRLAASHVIAASGSSRVELSDVAIEGQIDIDGAARATIRGGSIRSNDLALQVGTESHAQLSNVEIVATHGVRALGEAMVVLDGGSVRGERALRAHDDAVILHRGLALEGAVEAEGTIAEMHEGETTEAAVDRAQRTLVEKRARDARLEGYRELACSGIVECYEERGVEGTIGGRVVSFIGNDGTTTRAEVELDAAFPEIERCVHELAAGRTLADLDVPAAQLSCRFSGQLGDNRRVMTQPGYQPVAELPPAPEQAKRKRRKRHHRRRPR